MIFSTVCSHDLEWLLDCGASLVAEEGDCLVLKSSSRPGSWSHLVCCISHLMVGLSRPWLCRSRSLSCTVLWAQTFPSRFVITRFWYWNACGHKRCQLCEALAGAEELASHPVGNAWCPAGGLARGVLLRRSLSAM